MPYCKNCGNEITEEDKFCPKCGTPTRAEKPAEVNLPLTVGRELNLAFWGERFVAWLIDVVIIGVISWILNAILLLIGASFNLIPGWPDWIPFFNFNLNGIILFLYWMFMEGSNGQSFGKMIMRIKVVHLDGTQLNIGSAAVESVGKAFLLPLDLLLGVIIYPRKRQRIFNYLSKTIVVKQ